MTDARVADDLLDVLVDWGCRHIFSCPGSTEAAVLDALSKRDDIELVLVTHEAVAVSMADGLARVTRRPTVTYLHANGGLTNSLANLYAAELGYSPVVVLNGLKETGTQARAGFTTAPAMRDFVHQYVKFDWQSLDARHVTEDVNRAFRAAVTEPAGPAWVGISQDLLERPGPRGLDRADRYRFDSRTSPSPAAVKMFWTLVAESKRPVLVSGSHVARSDAVPDMVRLSEAINASVVQEERRSFERSAFPTDHPNFRGQYHEMNPVVAESDLIIFVGARVFNEFEHVRARSIPEGARVVHSHPDPSQVAVTHGVDLGIVSDAGMLLKAFLANAPATVARPGLPEYFKSERPSSSGCEPLPGRLRALEVIEVLAECLKGSAVVSDATTAGGELQSHLHQRGADDLFVSSSGSLGWGMGATLGVKMGMPDRPVAAVVGDGVFQFGVQALWTAAKQAIPVTYVVMNNERYAAVAAAQRRFAGEPLTNYLGTDISGVNLSEVSAGFGVPAQRVDSLAGLRSALRAARTVDHPVLVEVMTEPGELSP